MSYLIDCFKTRYKRFINIRKILEIKNLKDNWNGYGAKIISDKVINLAIKIVNKLDDQSFNIYPVARNSIQIEYNLDDRSYLEFEIFEDKISLLFIKGSDRSLPYGELKLLAINKYIRIYDNIAIDMNIIVDLFLNRQFDALAKFSNTMKNKGEYK